MFSYQRISLGVEESGSKTNCAMMSPGLRRSVLGPALHIPIYGNVLKKLKGSDEERKKGERKGRKGNGNEDIDNKMSALRE